MHSLKILLASICTTLIASHASGIEFTHISTFNDGEFYAITNGDKTPHSLFKKSQNYLRNGDKIVTEISLDSDSMKLLDQGSSHKRGKWKTFFAKGSYSVSFGNTQFTRTADLAIKLSVSRDVHANVSNIKLRIFQRDFSRSRSYGNINYLSGGLFNTDIKYQQTLTNHNSRINPLATNVSIQLNRRKNLHAAALAIFDQNNLEAILKNTYESNVNIRLVLTNNESSESVICLNQETKKGEFAIKLRPHTQSICTTPVATTRHNLKPIDFTHFN